MYDETVKRLKNCATQAAPCLTCDMTDDGSCIETLMKQAADAIEELRADKAALNGTVTNLLEQIKDLGKTRWIPVTEQLPKMIDGENISKDVYVTDGAEIAKACIMRDCDGVTGWTYTGIGEITHWCEQIPLPQPPIEEK